ncbi:MAG: c-type cytochrome [Gammaproteobacteria bacterium]
MLDRRFLTCVAALMLAAFSGGAAAGGDAERGALLADTCLGCHGIPGYRNAYPSYRVPKLGGLSEDYIVIALQGYRNETRDHATMQAQGATLSDQAMRDIAAFFAAQGTLEEGPPPDGPHIARGREKAAVCAACHGPNGVSTTGNWPSLAGQHRDYLRNVLNQYKTGARKDPVMAGQVISLSEEDIADLAAYFSALPGLFTVAYDD